MLASQALATAGNVLGVILIVAALFLREGEENGANSFVVALWSRVDDATKRGAARPAAFLHEVLLSSNRGVQWLVGPKLLSLRTLWASAALSLASFLLFVAGLFYLAAWTGKSHPVTDSLRYWWLPFGTIVAVASSQLPRAHRHAALLLWLALLAFIVPLTSSSLTTPLGRWAVGFLGVVSLAAVGSDLLVLWVLRAMSRRSRAARPLWAAAGALVISIALLYTITLGPLLVAGAIMHFSSVTDAVVQKHRELILPLLIPFFVSATNLLTAAFLFLYAAIWASALAQRFVFPLLERLLYPLARFGLFRMRKTVFAIGLLLLVGPQCFDAVIKLVK